MSESGNRALVFKIKEMPKGKKSEIVKISKEFSSALEETFGGINETGWLIVDPLSAYLNSIGFENTLEQMPKNEHHPLVLVMTFKDGSKLIPAGGDLKGVNSGFKNWIWL